MYQTQNKQQNKKESKGIYTYLTKQNEYYFTLYDPYQVTLIGVFFIMKTHFIFHMITMHVTTLRLKNLSKNMVCLVMVYFGQ